MHQDLKSAAAAANGNQTLFIPIRFEGNWSCRKRMNDVVQSQFVINFSALREFSLEFKMEQKTMEDALILYLSSSLKSHHLAHYHFGLTLCGSELMKMIHATRFWL